ncbi:DUF6542 domain-containing protein [Gordonia sp. CPCC 206044]|uniref:DUF6542 domain-containing protein n=1 Tax=Gordonia sp. CPCC 206044 TaxID=3140793 RepID=UPI003AF3FB60
MSSAQQQRSAVPLAQQSVLPTVRGVPWWGAVLVATVITAIGATIDASNTDALGAVFKFCYLVGCVAAALVVRRRALFTAAAQPPLIAFLVGVITLYGLNADQASSGLKSLIFKVLLPIANDFPWMALTFVVTLLLVAARWFLTGGRIFGKGFTPPARTGGTRGTGTSRTATPTKASAAKAGAKRPPRPAKPRTRQGDPDRATAKKAAATGGDGRRARTGTARDATRDASPNATAAPPAKKRPARGQNAAAKADGEARTSGSKASGRRATPPKSAGAQATAKRRATAGAVHRAEAGELIEPIERIAPDERVETGERRAAAAVRQRPAPTAGGPEPAVRSASAAAYPSTRGRYRG